jgi:hypothetical protein
MDKNQIQKLCNDIKLNLTASHALDVEPTSVEEISDNFYHANIYVDGERVESKIGLSVYNKFNKVEVFIPMVGYFPYDLNVTADEISKLFIDKKLNAI